MSIFNNFFKIFSKDVKDDQWIQEELQRRKQEQDETERIREEYSKQYKEWIEDIKKNPDKAKVKPTDLTKIDSFLEEDYDTFFYNYFLPDFNEWFNLKSDNTIRHQNITPKEMEDSVDNYLNSNKSLEDILKDYLTANHTNMSSEESNDLAKKLISQGNILGKIKNSINLEYVPVDDIKKKYVNKVNITNYLEKEVDDDVDMNPKYDMSPKYKELGQYILETYLQDITTNIEKYLNKDSNFLLNKKTVNILENEIDRVIGILLGKPDILKDYNINIPKKNNKGRFSNTRDYKTYLGIVNRFNKIIKPLLFSSILSELQNHSKIVSLTKNTNEYETYMNKLSECIKRMSVRGDASEEISSIINFCNILHEVNTYYYSDMMDVVKKISINYRDFVNITDAIYEAYINLNNKDTKLIDNKYKIRLLNLLNNNRDFILSTAKKIEDLLKTYTEQYKGMQIEDDSASIGQ